jgi:hypothetical protein
MSTLVAALLGGLSLAVAQALVGLVVRPSNITAPAGAWPWWIASQILLAGTLAVLARRARIAGPALAAALFVVAAVIGPVSAFIEGVVFDIFAGSRWPSFSSSPW